MLVFLFFKNLLIKFSRVGLLYQKPVALKLKLGALELIGVQNYLNNVFEQYNFFFIFMQILCFLKFYPFSKITPIEIEILKKFNIFYLNYSCIMRRKIKHISFRVHYITNKVSTSCSWV